MVDTSKISVTLPDETIEWLSETYPDAKSDSELVSMAISDARKLNKLLGANRVNSVTVEGDDQPRTDGGEDEQPSDPWDALDHAVSHPQD